MRETLIVIAMSINTKEKDSHTKFRGEGDVPEL